MSDVVLIFAIFGAVFFPLGATFFLIGFFRARPIKYYDRTPGVIIRKKRQFSFNLLQPSKNNPNKRRLRLNQGPTVLYSVEGKEYTYTSTMSQNPVLKIGTKVNVFYDRYQPEKAIIDTFVQRGTIFTLIGSIFIILNLICLSIAAFFYFDIHLI